MKTVIFIMLIFVYIFIFPEQIIRIDRAYMDRIPLKAIDIAGTHPVKGWIDIVVNNEELNKIRNANIPFTVRKLTGTKASVYMSADSIIDSMIVMANKFPSIVKLDTLYFSSSNQYPLVCLKISDNVNIDEYNEPAGLFVAMHHSREWQTPGTVLFFIDSLLKSYANNDSVAINYINNLELYFMPLVNPEGYMYSRTVDNLWRKTRIYLPQYSSYGVDANRNYGIALSAEQSWGTTPNSATTHYPTEDVFCGPYPFTGTEIKAVRDIIVSHPNMYLSVSYHSYSELVIYPWGSTMDTAVHNAQLKSFASEMASRLICRDGVSTYTPGQSVGLYATTGDMTDWAYAYCLYVLGRGHLSFTVEEDTEFQPTESTLDTLYRQQYQGFLYSIAYLDSMIDFPDYIPKPISIIDTLTAFYSDSNNVRSDINWSEIKDANSNIFKIKRYIGLKDTIDNLNSASLWQLNGFLLDNTHTPLSGNYLLWSGNASNSFVDARTKIPFLTNTEDTIFSIYIKYDIETNYDAAYIELSQNGVFWELIDTTAVFTGNDYVWTKKNYIIPQKYRNSQLFFRVRYSTDASVENTGMLVDSVFCVGTVIDTSILDSTISVFNYTDTLSDTNAYYSITGKNIFNWGIESNIVKTEYNSTSLAKPNIKFENVFYNEFISLSNLYTNNYLSFVYKLNKSKRVDIYNNNGTKIKSFNVPAGSGTINVEFPFAAGIYFIKYDNRTIKFNYMY